LDGLDGLDGIDVELDELHDGLDDDYIFDVGFVDGNSELVSFYFCLLDLLYKFNFSRKIY